MLVLSLSKKILKWLAIVLIGFVAFLILGGLYVHFFYERPEPSPIPFHDLPPIATQTLIKPTERHRTGSMFRVDYEYGILTISRDMQVSLRTRHNRMFMDIDTAMPEFGDKVSLKKANPIDKVRLMLEVDRLGTQGVPFSDIYPGFAKLQDEGRFPKKANDFRFPDLDGYQQENGRGVYILKNVDIKSPTGTPITVSCSRDDSLSQDYKSKKGSCRYNLVFDPLLRVQVRFSKPNLHHFTALHQNTMGLINSIREIK